MSNNFYTDHASKSDSSMEIQHPQLDGGSNMFRNWNRLILLIFEAMTFCPDVRADRKSVV